MKRLLSILFIILLLVGCTQPAAEAPETTASELAYGDITGEELVSLIGSDVMIIDVRTAEEYSQGHIEGAVNIPVDRFQTEFDELELSKDQPLAIYCRSGNRSSFAYQILTKEGFDKVYHAPGVSQYNYPLVK